MEAKRTTSQEPGAGRQPLIGMTLAELRGVAAEFGMPTYAAGQIAQWLYAKRVATLGAMTNLSKGARERLGERYAVGLTPPKAAQRSADGTVKYLFGGVGGRDVEAVYIPDRERATLCVSSQAGCRMGCHFCMTGRQGFHGNLTAAQIVNQVLAIPEASRLTNVVFMGMGEPLDNLDAVVRAIAVLTESWGLAWSPKRITVSTVGKLDTLRELLERTRVHVAVSVHSPYAEERASLMPVERAYPVKEVLALLRGYDFAHQRRLSVEYTMWRGVNDSLRHAQGLARLLRGLDVRVNLIRYHAIEGCELRPAEGEAMVAFRDRLNELGITATIRASRGEDIAAACGMLAGRQQDNG